MDGSWEKVTEDESGWAGSSDLIVTTPVPSQLLENGDWDAALLVTMSIHCAFYMETLGPELFIYMTSSTDKRHLHTSNFPPGTSQERFHPELNRDMESLNLEQDRPVIISASQSNGPLVYRQRHGRALFAAVGRARTLRTSHLSLLSKNSNALLLALQLQCSRLFLM
jgi:hypothetical protein